MDPNTELMIDQVTYDAYFILGVTPEDSMDHITKEYRKKAKTLHPDKLSASDKLDPKKVLKRSKQFKILVDCYMFIQNKKQRYNETYNQTEHEPIINNTGIDPHLLLPQKILYFNLQIYCYCMIWAVFCLFILYSPH